MKLWRPPMVKSVRRPLAKGVVLLPRLCNLGMIPSNHEKLYDVEDKNIS